MVFSFLASLKIFSFESFVNNLSDFHGLYQHKTSEIFLCFQSSNRVTGYSHNCCYFFCGWWENLFSTYWDLDFSVYPSIFIIDTREDYCVYFLDHLFWERFFWLDKCIDCLCEVFGFMEFSEGFSSYSQSIFYDEPGFSEREGASFYSVWVVDFEYTHTLIECIQFSCRKESHIFYGRHESIYLRKEDIEGWQIHRLDYIDFPYSQTENFSIFYDILWKSIDKVWKYNIYTNIFI